MQVPGSANALMLGGEAAPYTISRSLRFRKASSAYLARTPGSSGNQQKWTISAWLKRGSLDADQTVFEAYSSNPWFAITFDPSNRINVGQTYGTSSAWYTTAVFRDPAAWYHVTVVVDTTSATSTISNGSTDRIRLYVNGVQQSLSGGTVPSQNANLQVNSTIGHRIGGSALMPYFDGYLTDFYLIDGQALTPSSFGETDIVTGVWKPKAYSGSYGTNGFRLDFSDNSAATAAAIGKDASGNGNNWTPNNISVTSGANYDSMTDVPTLTSATAANYAVLNPLVQDPSSGTATLSDGNLKTTYLGASNRQAFSTIGISSGKYYWEHTVISGGSAAIFFGISDLKQTTFRAYTSNTGEYWNGSAWTAYGATFSTGDIIGIAVDMTSQTIEFFKNNVSQGQKTSIGLSGLTVFSVTWCDSSGVSGAVNFGQRPFAYTPPTGFVALNTFNLPDPTIKKGNAYFDATVYSGTNGSQSVVNSGGFKPDLVWVKARNQTNWHKFTDAVRGAIKAFYVNDTGGEDTNPIYGVISAFNSNGFTVGNGTNNTAEDVNASGSNYVSWQWKANGSTVSNTAGSITSTVSANPSAGFSIVNWTGNGTNGSTVGHGLGVAPSLVIYKNRTGTNNWPTTSLPMLGNYGYLYINNNSAKGTAAEALGAHTSSVLVLPSYNDCNGSGNSMMAYCWSEVAGFSKFGSYTGNGSNDGTFVYLGFRPRWIMYKRRDNLGNWGILDSARSPYNQDTPLLFASTNDAEFAGAGSYEFDILSNGFKVRNTANGDNGSGEVYIFAAFAENPFKYSLAR